ncbi:MAG TPA: ArgR family transcriptional regulator [Spirochaetia bacterium]|nr:ArgR family transcriptional regulator [Spirochaetia bacterium]
MKIEDKAERLNAIRAILGERRVSSQEQLLGLLKKRGFAVTQATLSRDLKNLNVGKNPDGEGGYYYGLPSESSARELLEAADPDLFLRGFISIEFSGNLGVIRTLPGYANSVASNLDRLRIGEILGTIAGDDTVLVIPRDGIKRNRIIKALYERIPAIKEKMG